MHLGCPHSDGSIRMTILDTAETGRMVPSYELRGARTPVNQPEADPSAPGVLLICWTWNRSHSHRGGWRRVRRLEISWRCRESCAEPVAAPIGVPFLSTQSEIPSITLGSKFLAHLAPNLEMEPITLAPRQCLRTTASFGVVILVFDMARY